MRVLAYDWFLSMCHEAVKRFTPCRWSPAAPEQRARRRVAVALRNGHVVHAPSTMNSLYARRIVHHDRAVARLTRRLPLGGSPHHPTGHCNVSAHSIYMPTLDRDTFRRASQTVRVYGLFISVKFRHNSK